MNKNENTYEMNFIFLRFIEVWTQRVPCKVNVAPEGSRALRASLTLHVTRCIHTSTNLRKMKFISYIVSFCLTEIKDFVLLIFLWLRFVIVALPELFC